MRRSTKLLVGLVAAILTYVSLMVFAGPAYRGRHGFYSHSAEGQYSRHHCREQGSRHREHSGANPRQETPPADIPRNNP
jgi:hypothetical protein